MNKSTIDYLEREVEKRDTLLVRMYRCEYCHRLRAITDDEIVNYPRHCSCNGNSWIKVKIMEE